MRFNQIHLLAVNQYPHWDVWCQNRGISFWENFFQVKNWLNLTFPTFKMTSRTIQPKSIFLQYIGNFLRKLHNKEFARGGQTDGLTDKSAIDKLRCHLTGGDEKWSQSLILWYSTFRMERFRPTFHIFNIRLCNFVEHLFLRIFHYKITLTNSQSQVG